MPPWKISEIKVKVTGSMDMGIMVDLYFIKGRGLVGRSRGGRGGGGVFGNLGF